MPDWQAIKQEYITSDIGYRPLAAQNGVPFRTLSQRAAREGWVAARQAYRDDVMSKTLHRTASRTASDNARKLEALQASADAMSNVILSVFSDSDQFHRHLIQRGLGEGVSDTEERIYSKVDTRAIRDLTTAMRDLASIIRSVYDLPTRQEQSAMDIAVARLELDKGKAQAQTDIDDSTTGVVELTPVIDDADAQTGEEDITDGEKK